MLVLVPEASFVPTQKPAITAAGNPALKRLTKKEISAFYNHVVCGYFLVTVIEALAVSPSIDRVRIVSVRKGGADAYGKPKVEALLGASFTRVKLAAVRWDLADSDAIVGETSE